MGGERDASDSSDDESDDDSSGSGSDNGDSGSEADVSNYILYCNTGLELDHTTPN